MVLHGILPYTGEELNGSPDYEESVLRLAEYGAIPYFRWIYEKNLALKNTDYNYYSIHYENWIEKAASTYKQLQEVLEPCLGQTIERHDVQSGSVAVTTYDNGYRVYVNYKDVPVKIDGLQLGPKRFAGKMQ
jgi:hypothetical protein